MRKINLYFLTFIFLFFTNPTFSIEQEIKDIVDTIDAAKKDFNNVLRGTKGHQLPLAAGQFTCKLPPN